MNNVLAKKFSFRLNTKSTKIYKDKSFVCYDTDSIELAIEVYEDELFKDLKGSRIEIIYSYPNGESDPIRQTIEDGGILTNSNNIIYITPKSNCLMPTDNLRMDINIYDEDEFITLQPFMFRIIKSVESEIFEKAEDIVKNMKSITDQMTDLIKGIEDLKELANTKEVEIDNQIQTIISAVDNTVENTSQKLIEIQEEANVKYNDFMSSTEIRVDNFINESYAEVDSLMTRISNVNVELDEVFLRSMPLSPMEYNEKILFVTDIILNLPYNMVNKTYILNVTGSPYNSNVITTNLGMLYFTLENDNVVINYAPIVNKSIQGKSITVTPQFNNMSNSISSGTSSFRICISTNLPIDLIDNAVCTITSNIAIGNDL